MTSTASTAGTAATATAMNVRPLNPLAGAIDVSGTISAASEGALMDAYARVCGDHTRAIILNFSKLEYMNSGGIGLLVTLLVRANRQGQRLLAVGLDEHYREIFSLTRLDEAISIHDDEQSAVRSIV